MVDSGIMALPHCDISVIGSLIGRRGHAFSPLVLGSGWRLSACLSRTLGFSRDCISSTRLCLQGAVTDWRRGLRDVMGIELRDHECSEDELWKRIDDASDRFGVAVVVDEFYLPWAPGFGRQHGLSPHVIGVPGESSQGKVAVIESLSDWSGWFELTREEITVAAFPPVNPHALNGWLIEIDGEPNEDGIYRAAERLGQDLHFYGLNPGPHSCGCAVSEDFRMGGMEAGQVLGDMMAALQALSSVRGGEWHHLQFQLTGVVGCVEMIAFCRRSTAELLTLLDGRISPFADRVRLVERAWSGIARALNAARTGRMSVQELITEWRAAVRRDMETADALRSMLHQPGTRVGGVLRGESPS